MPLVTIIVPAYNAGLTIYDCIISCISQTYSNIEIIIVDDSSTDNTADIVYECALKFKNIKYIKNSKSGVTDARNLGLDCALGEYIFFLDADDMLPKNSIQDLYDCLVNKQAKAATGTVIHEDENGAVITHICYDSLSEITGFLWLQEIRKRWCGHIWGILFHRSLFNQKAHCPSNLRIGEDLLQLAQIATKCDKIAITNAIVYRYIKHRGSVINSRVFNQNNAIIDEDIFAEEILRLAETCEVSVRTEYRLLAIYAILNIPDLKVRGELINKYKTRFLKFLVFDYGIISELISISFKLYLGVVFSLLNIKS